MRKILTAALLLWMPIAKAQSPAAPASQTAALTSRTTLVLVPTMVTTKAGEPVFTLQAKDFVVTDDGVEQKVSLEEDTGGEPLALAVVIETGGAGAQQLEKYRGLGP